MVKARAHVYVSGHVHGVFFRYETKELADKLGLKGWVRNLPDGRVEAIFEGDKKAIEEMLEFCKRGPPGARVTDVEMKWQNYEGQFKEFTIRYW
jgi:acylphosphatase